MSRCALHAGNKAQSIAALRSIVEMKGYCVCQLTRAQRATMMTRDSLRLTSLEETTARCGRGYLSIGGIVAAVSKIDAAIYRFARECSFPLPSSTHPPIPPALLRACNWVGSLVNASRQNYRNHANDKIFSPRGNFTSSTMAHDGGATIPERVLSLIATRHDAATGKIVCKW